MPEKNQHDLVAVRTETILRAIKSGVNECNTLMCGGKLNEGFVRNSVRPTIQVCIDEADQLRKDNAVLRDKANFTNFTLEYLCSNIPNGDLLLAQAHEHYATRLKTTNVSLN